MGERFRKDQRYREAKRGWEKDGRGNREDY